MSNKVLTFEFESTMVENADLVLNEIGLDIATYFRIALLKLVKEQRIPFNLSASQPSVDSNVAQPVFVPAASPTGEDLFRTGFKKSEPRQLGKITNDMCQSIWNEFKARSSSRDVNLLESAQRISTQTGMNRGSAFIYFTILNNLINGVQNTRALKFEDLEFFISKIESEFPASTLSAAIISLEASIPYWDEKLPGSFAEKVSMLVDRLKRN